METIETTVVESTEIENQPSGKPGRPSRFTEAQISKLRDLLGAGKTAKEIASECGMPEVSVQYYRRKFSPGTKTFGLRSDGALQTLETSLLTRLDSEIASLQVSLEESRTRLKDLMAKRSRLARALGVVETAEETVEAVTQTEE